MSLRELATKVAWAYLGKPYRWGGDDPIAGFDCSGLCVEILKSVGRLPRKGDWTAAQLAEHFHPATTPIEGCLVYWISTGAISHIEYCIDSDHSIGASGGGKATLTEAEAIAQNAFIKVRPFRSRPGAIGFVDPFVSAM